MRSLKTIILLLHLFKLYIGINIRGKPTIRNLMGSKDKKVEITTLNSKYLPVIQIPSGRTKIYQIEAGTSGKYKVTSGSSAYVNSYGTVYPRNVTWHWYGGRGYSSPLPDQEPDRIETKFYPGITVITATVGDGSFKITVTVKEYSEEYVEKIVDDYIKSNVTKKKNTLDKFRAITAFPAQYPYNGSYHDYIDMVIFGGADCWGSAYLIQHFCEKVGIKSHVRFAARDPLSGSGHRNVAALIDKKIYIGEAGYGYNYPNRPWNVEEKNVGFFYRTSGNEITIYQYDGYEEDIKVPSIIDKKTVVGFIYNCFSIGESWSGIKIKKITLPKTTISIEELTFNDLKYLKEVNIPFNVSSKITASYFKGCDNLTEINIDKGNSLYSSDDGVLYNKNKTVIIKFPSGKKGTFTVPSSVERIEDYAFNSTKNLEIVKIKKKVNYIGKNAFAYSNVKEIYFYGEKPEFNDNPFLNLNGTIFYPENSKSWNNTNFDNLCSKTIQSFSWKPKEGSNSHAGLIAFIVIAIFVILGVIAFIIIRKKRKSLTIDSIKGTLLR